MSDFNENPLGAVKWGFTTRRLRAEPWHSHAGDNPGLTATVKRLLTPEVTASLPGSWQGAYDENRVKQWIADRDDEGTTLLICENGTFEPVGLLLVHASRSGGDSDIELRVGYLLGKEFWGMGYGTELLVGLVGWARAIGVGSIVAGVSGDNIASRKVLEKSDFVRCDSTSGTELFYQIRFDQKREK